MVKDQEIKEARDAHRRALARACRPKRSGDEDSTTIREHRQAHRWNVVHDEMPDKRGVPTVPPYNIQKPLDHAGETE